MSTAKKKQDYGKLFKDGNQDDAAIEKAQVEQLRKKLIEELNNPEKAKKAALYIEQLIKEKK